jgi:drug/metabolite transporter (DMT)-like permease
MTRADTLRILALGFFGYYLSSYLNFLGLQHVSVGLERIILYLNPTIVLLISVLFLGKHIAPRQWLAMGIAYLGVTLVFVHDVRFDGGRVLLGGALVFLCAITYAIYLIMAGQIVHRVGSLRLVAYASGSSTVFCVLQALLTDPRALVQQDAAVYGLSLINASLCTFVPMLLIMMAVHRIGPSLTAQAGVVGPVATVLLGWYFLGEPIGGLQLLGMAVVIGSVALLMTVSAAPAAPAFSGD